MVGGMPAGYNDRYAGNKLGIAIQELPLTHMRDRREIFLEVTRTCPLVGPHRILVLAALHEVFSLRKRRHDLVVLAHGISPAVIEVQVRVDDHVDVLMREANPFQRVFERRFALDGEAVLKPRVHLRPKPGVHQDILAVCPDQQAVESHLDAVLLVRRTALLPQHFGHDPEHRAPIQPKPPIRHRIYFKLSEFHSTTGSLYVPKTSFSAAQISPSVASAFTASRRYGIKLSSPAAASCNASSVPAILKGSRRDRSDASRSTWALSTSGPILRIGMRCSSGSTYSLTPTMIRSFRSTSRW